MMTMFPKMIVAMAALLLVVPAHAQSFSNRLKDVAERAVKSGVERKVDNEVRKATRCVLGDDRCIQEAQRRGEQVEIVQVGSPQPVSSGGYTQATSAAGHGLARATSPPTRPRWLQGLIAMARSPWVG